MKAKKVWVERTAEPAAWAQVLCEVGSPRQQLKVRDPANGAGPVCAVFCCAGGKSVRPRNTPGPDRAGASGDGKTSWSASLVSGSFGEDMRDYPSSCNCQ